MKKCELISIIGALTKCQICTKLMSCWHIG